MVKNLKSGLFIAAAVGLLSLFRLAMPADLNINEEMSPFFKTFPLQVGGWTGKEIPADEKTLEILETRNVLSREYASESGDKVFLLMVSSRKDRRVAHPPEVCYLGSNYNIADEKETTLSLDGGSGHIDVKEFRAVHERFPDNKQEVLYLYRVGDVFTTSYYAQQLRFAVDRLTRADSEVLLIRIAGTDRGNVRAFLNELLPLLRK